MPSHHIHNMLYNPAVLLGLNVAIGARKNDAKPTQDLRPE
jgi:hypothetical protein